MAEISSNTTPVLSNGVIIVDFDGTLCKHKFPEVGKPEPNVKQALERLKSLGYTIRVHSCRTALYWKYFHYHLFRPKHHIKAIQDFMKENDLPYDDIIVEANMDKPIAEYYIDDRAIRYKGDWLDVVNQIEAER